MSSSEDYLDSLLKSMGVPAELASPTKKEEPILEPVVEPEPEPTPEPVVEAVPEVEAIAESAPAVEPIVEPEPELIPEQVIELEPEPAPEPIVETVPEIEPVIEAVSEPQPEPVPEPIIETVPEIESVAESVPEVEPVSEDEAPELGMDENNSTQMSLDDFFEGTIELVPDHSDEIPSLIDIMNEDPNISDVHIDSAPSLEIPQGDVAIDENDISDLMNGFMSKINEEDKAAGIVEDVTVSDDVSSSDDVIIPEDVVISDNEPVNYEPPVEAPVVGAPVMDESSVEASSVEEPVVDETQTEEKSADEILSDEVETEAPAEEADELDKLLSELTADLSTSGSSSDIDMENPAGTETVLGELEESGAPVAEESGDGTENVDMDALLAELTATPDEVDSLMDENVDAPTKGDSDSEIDLDALLNDMNSLDTDSDISLSEDAISDDPVSEGETASADEPSAEEPTPSEEPASDESAPEVPLKSGDLDDFDLEAELAELEKEENESVDLPGEDDIEAMLSKARSEGLAEDADRFEMSLDDLMAADSGSVSDVADLLDKNENNEAVDPGIIALMNGTDLEDAEIPDFEGDGAVEGAETGEPKKLTLAEKLAAKKAERAEKARKKKEAKEAKKAAKKAGKEIKYENENVLDNAENADMTDVDALLASAAQAASESKESALSTDAVPVPREDSDSSLEDDLMAEIGLGPEIPDDVSDAGSYEPSAADEADSLLAEIMGEFSDDESSADLGTDSSDEPPFGADAFADEAPGSAASDVDNLIDNETASEEKPKKKGLFGRLLDMLTETDEEEPDDVSEIKLSDENAQVLEELDAEGDDGKKKKKKKDKKGKKKEAAAEGEGEEGEEGGGDSKKKKKEKKPKKEKAPKEPSDEKPGKKLNKKKVIAVFALCITILVAVLIVSNLMGSYTVKKEARQAYSEGDYQTAYQDLFGQDLNESDQIIFKKSECILRIRLWQKEYELLKQESDIKALDSLIQSVSQYPGLYQSAVKWQCLGDVEPVYNELLTALETNYGLTAEDAAEIAMIKKDVDYTRAIYDVVNGLYGVPEEERAPEEPEPEPIVIDDEIPGESDPGEGIVFVNP